MNVVIHISSNSGTPIYLQIVQQLRYQLASGRLLPGDELPPIRTLAERLLTNPNTVARAYRELESEGLLTSRVGSGTRVSDRGSRLALDERIRILGEYADTMLAVARQLNFTLEDSMETLRVRYAHMRSGEAGQASGAGAPEPNAENSHE